MKSFRIWSFSGPYYPVFGVNTERYSPCSVRRQENTDKKNSEYGHLPRSEIDGYEMTHNMQYDPNKLYSTPITISRK